MMSHPEKEVLPPQWEALARTFVQAERIFCFEDDSDLPITARKFSSQDAHELQLRLLPNRPPHVPGYDLVAVSYPAAIVGGDHFNFCPVGGDKVGILIFDVSGKGPPAALVAARLRSIFRTQSWGNRDVRDVLSRAHAFLCRILPPAHFVTAIYGILDPKSRQFSFARAGHEPLLHVHAGQENTTEVEMHAPMGLPLGVGTHTEFLELLETQTLQLERGDRLLFFTDGLTEARDALANEFGMERIIMTLRASQGDDIPLLCDTVARFCEGQAPHDDLTLLSLSVR
ncbi:phosphoserine phosphatase RsbU [Abditibacteriota bacterium]|nr:phosphoserine phosphatase RsbU [Abditibacteriota bacterium]